MSERGIREFYYNHQLRNYIAQFMAIFAGLRVQTGVNDDKEPKMISTPIQHASKDRVVGFLKSEMTQNKPVRLPIMSAYINGVDIAADRRKGSPVTRRQTYMPNQGLFPDDISVSEQRMPVPYQLNMELSIWASNQDQHYQLLEQILSIFNPILQIQTSDEPLDWTKITTVELVNINPEENVPMGTDRRFIRTTMNFQTIAYLSVPAKVHQRYVKDIMVRVGAVGKAAESNRDIIAALDEQGLEYEELFTLDNIDLGQDDQDEN